MNGSSWFTPLRIISFVVLLSMLTALLYTGWIVLTEWSGIGV